MQTCEACRTQFDPNMQRHRHFLGRHTFCNECQVRFHYLNECITDASDTCMAFHAMEYKVSEVLSVAYDKYAFRNELSWRRMDLPSRKEMLRRQGTQVWQQFSEEYFKQFGMNMIRNLRRRLLRSLRRHNYKLGNRLKAIIKSISDLEISLTFHSIRKRKIICGSRVDISFVDWQLKKMLPSSWSGPF